MEIVPLGDNALIVRVRNRFDDKPEETLDKVLLVFRQLQAASIPGVIELVPAYTSVAVFFDPVIVAKATETSDKLFNWLATRIRAAVADVAGHGHKKRSVSRTVEIPVSYDPEFAV